MLQVIRSRLQEQGQVRNSKPQYAGGIDCLKQLLQKEGFSGLYRGCGTNLLRTTPSAVITFTAYEMIHQFLDRALPPDDKHSKAHPKPDDNINPSKQSKGMGEGNNFKLSRSEITSNEQTPLIPLRNTDQRTAER